MSKAAFSASLAFCNAVCALETAVFKSDKAFAMSCGVALAGKLLITLAAALTLASSDTFDVVVSVALVAASFATSFMASVNFFSAAAMSAIEAVDPSANKPSRSLLAFLTESASINEAAVSVSFLTADFTAVSSVFFASSTA